MCAGGSSAHAHWAAVDTQRGEGGGNAAEAGPSGSMVGAPERGNWVAHELLLALLGYTGDVFTAEHRRSIGAKVTASTAARTLAMTKEDEVGEEDIDAELEVRVVLSAAARQSFPSAAECEVLERAVELGGHAITLRHLSDALTRNGLGNAEGPSGRSLYWRAVATGIGEVLDVYAESVLRLEGVILGGAGSTECSSSICGLQSAELADARAYLLHRGGAGLLRWRDFLCDCHPVARRHFDFAELVGRIARASRGGAVADVLDQGGRLEVIRVEVSLTERGG